MSTKIHFLRFCGAAVITKGPLERVNDICMSDVDHSTSSTLAELHGLNREIDRAQKHALRKLVVIICDNMAALDWRTENSQRPTSSWITAKLTCLLMAVQDLVTLTFFRVLAP